MTTTFPRALAVAERLWSPRDTRNTTDAAERVSSLRCRFLSRGLPIPPVNSGGWGAGGLDGDFCPTPARFNYRAPY
jgi:hexosaminidase